MPMSVTPRIKPQAGFTLVELLITLVILGLASSLVGPALFSWLDSREAASRRTTLENSLAMLPLEVQRKGEAVTIENAVDLGIDDIRGITINEPVRILSNGYCQGGRVTLTLSARQYQYQVLPPFCEVALVPTT